MPKHPRLCRRGATYYHRAAIPVDIADSYPKTEETFSLGTKDHQEAVRRVRVAAAEVDRRFEAHRRMLAQKAKPPLKELSDEEIKRIGEVYYTFLLEEDETIRTEQFSEEERPTIVLEDDADVNEIISAYGFRPPSFERYAEGKDALDELTRHDYARGKVNSFYKGEAEEVLTWEEISVNLDPASPSWRKLARELQAATIKATKAVRLRNEGEVVETPRVPFEDACRDSDIPKEIMDALQGHGQEGMSERYGRGYYLKKLDEAVKRLRYRDLDLSHLNALAKSNESINVGSVTRSISGPDV